MRFVIIGASGHIGNNVVRALAGAYPEAELAVLTRRPIDKELAGVSCVQLVGDLFDPQFLADAICDLTLLSLSFSISAVSFTV